MNDRYFADKIIELSNKELEINEYRDRIIAILAEVRAEERSKRVDEGIKQYKRIDAENPIVRLPSEVSEDKRHIPIVVSLTKEARFTPEDKIGED